MPTEYILAYHCAPAFAGIKPSNIASCSKSDNPNIACQVKTLNEQLNKNDIYIDVLCECGERVLVMVYRKQKLCEYLQREDIKSFLCDNGYPKEFSLTKYLAILKSRIYAQRLMNKEFPHEIGAFLGYPLHDIYGFINHKHQGCLLTGEWKVYENTEQAEKLFCRYNKCRRAVIKMSKTAIIYWSGTGNTEAMANAIFDGAKEVNADTKLFSVDQITADEAKDYNNLILGCPAMGAEELEEGEFEPFFAELEVNLSGKNVALFGSYGWGDGEWMREWEKRVTDAGAKLANESVIVNDSPDEDAVTACNGLGKIVATL